MYDIVFDSEKNRWLKEHRGISFEEVIALMEAGDYRLGKHPNTTKYPHQYIIEINIAHYAYRAPCLLEGKTIILKTIYPSREATKRWRQNDD